jgi:very-short-patch-repair endonuclease
MEMLDPMPCKECEASVRLPNTKGNRERMRSGAIYCSETCKRTWVSRKHSETMAATNRKHARGRMLARNPMRSEATRTKVSRRLKAMGHGPPVRGGNGKGPTAMEARLFLRLPMGWRLNFVVATKQPRGSGYPTCYKLDMAQPEIRLAVEVDGGSHAALVRRAQDAKKTAFLQSLGWTVLRFTNAEVQTDLDRCVQEIASTTLRLTATTTTSWTAS